ncbi:MAG: division plane positioning ATPase MipZ [Pseudomonadota bacterium]
MKPIKLPYVFVIGNEKGGAGKTTCSMHLIAGMLDSGLKVSSIDIDCRQHSLTRYIQNREIYNSKNPTKPVPMSKHFLLKEGTAPNVSEREMEEKDQFEKVFQEASKQGDVIIIDTPGSHSFLSRLAHSYADTVVTPINDSFLDIDVMAKINPDDLSVVEPSIYSQMIWEQKMERAKRDRGSIEWVVMRNRLSNLDATNKRSVAEVLDKLSKRISFKLAPGFSERVIFRELFLQGLTLLDLTKANYEKSFSISHVAARQELREFLKCLNIEEILTSTKALAK